MTPEFLQTIRSRLLVGTLARAGVRHAVVSPGSRSTPFLSALLLEKSVTVHLVIDERSAGFVGIGLARASVSPVLLLCTSGTAAANYLPSIVEASQAGVPLIALTADRPIDAQHARAPQTIDQTHMYGHHVRRFFELGEATTAGQSLRGFRRLVSSAVQIACGPNSGPVHLNARARRPLQPCLPQDDKARALECEVTALLREAHPSMIEGKASPEPEQLKLLAAECVQSRKGLIVCGFDAHTPALDPDVLAQFAKATGYPVWLDVSHPLRWDHPLTLSDYVLRCAELLHGCEQFIAQFCPQMVVQVGPPLTSSLWEHWIEQGRARKHIVVAREGWPDPSGQSDAVVVGDPSQTLRALTRAIEATRGEAFGEKPWFLDWRHGDARATQVLREWMNSQDAFLGELQIVRAAIESCPRGARVVLGNSLPLREAELVVPAGDRGICAFAIRGANGIDGLLSTGVGAALSGSRPTLILLGDISFLHDIGALWTARTVRNPLAIVILDNHGGRIFEQLPVYDYMDHEMLNFWTTPHELDVKAAGQLYGIATELPSNLAEFQSSVRQALKRPGPTLIPMPIDPSSPRLDVKSLRRTIDASVFE